MHVSFDPGKLNMGVVKKKKARRGIGSNICKLHLVHVHLHWLASRPTLISFFFLDQSATPATGNIFEHAFLLVLSSSSPPFQSFWKHGPSLSRNSLALVTFLLPFIIHLIPYLSLLHSFRSKNSIPCFSIYVL